MSVVVEIDTGHKRSLAELWGGAPAEPVPAETAPAETAYGQPRR